MTLAQMSDAELLQAWSKGCTWTRDRMQVTGTRYNELGLRYNHVEFETGLLRITQLEDEMNKRNMIYG